MIEIPLAHFFQKSEGDIQGKLHSWTVIGTWGAISSAMIFSAPIGRTIAMLILQAALLLVSEDVERVVRAFPRGRKYTRDCFNHDSCVKNLGTTALSCDTMFTLCVDAAAERQGAEE